jgi:hypothetical protein
MSEAFLAPVAENRELKKKERKKEKKEAFKSRRLFSDEH